MLAHDIGNFDLQLPSGQTPAVEVSFAALFDQAVGDVVAQPGAVAFVFECDGVRRSPVSSKSFPQRRDLRFAEILGPAAQGGALLQLELDPVPPLGIDDRRMLAIMHLVPVPDAARVERVRQDVMDVTPVEQIAAGGRLPSLVSSRRRLLSARRSASSLTSRIVPSRS